MSDDVEQDWKVMPHGQKLFLAILYLGLVTALLFVPKFNEGWQTALLGLFGTLVGALLGGWVAIYTQRQSLQHEREMRSQDASERDRQRMVERQLIALDHISDGIILLNKSFSFYLSKCREHAPSIDFWEPYNELARARIEFRCRMVMLPYAEVIDASQHLLEITEEDYLKGIPTTESVNLVNMFEKRAFILSNEIKLCKTLIESGQDNLPPAPPQ